MTVGWVKVEQTPGRPKWHYFDLAVMTRNGVTKQSLCGRVSFYHTPDAVMRNITGAGNCRACAKILKKKDSGQAGMTDNQKGETS